MQNISKKDNKIIVRHVSNATPAGQLAVVTGDGFDGAKIFLRKLAAERKCLKTR